MRSLLVLTLVALGSMGLLWFALPRVARFFIYHPEPLRPQESDPKYWGFPRARELTFRARDGVELHAWWFPAYAGLPASSRRSGRGGGSGPGSDAESSGSRSDSAGRADGPGRRRGVAVYYHGNAGHLAYRGEIAAALSALGLDVLLPDYRGYGLSAGRPGESGLYLDGDAAWRRALELSGLGPERLLLVGNSLGSAVAADVGRRRPTAGLILLGPFTSTVAVGRHTMRWLPDWLLDWDDDRFDVLSRAEEIRVPVLVAVGSEDHMIPESMARRLYEALPGPKRWYVASGAGHDDVWSHEGVWREVQEFVGGVLPWDRE